MNEVVSFQRVILEVFLHRVHFDHDIADGGTEFLKDIKFQDPSSASDL